MKKILLTLCLLWWIPTTLAAINIPDSSIQGGKTEVGNLLTNEITQHTDLTSEIVRVVNWLLGFLGLACILILIVSGVQVIMSGGNDDKIKKLWKTIRYVVTGLLIIAFSYGIVNFVITGIVEQTDDSGGKITARFSCLPHTVEGAQLHSLACDASTSTEGVDTYLWNFGDGGNEVSSNGAMLIHAFPTTDTYPHKYNIKLQVSKAGETATTSHSYNVQ